jgi:DNA (cytosine-5)-methyltransferase 1
MLENVRGFASDKFITYRRDLFAELERLGYRPDWRILEAASFGVPQLRPRFVLVALRPRAFNRFRWPVVSDVRATVGEAIGDLMDERGWPGAAEWRTRANAIAPTIVGGSKKHGGPDLGPSRAKRQWAALGVDGMGIVDEPPGPEYPLGASPRLTVRMVARLQGFSDSWEFVGRKTSAYRQVGNAFPPPVAEAVGRAIMHALTEKEHAPQLEPAVLELTA